MSSQPLTDSSYVVVDFENDVNESVGDSLISAGSSSIFTEWRQIGIVWSQLGVIRQLVWQKIFCTFANVLPQSNLVFTNLSLKVLYKQPFLHKSSHTLALNRGQPCVILWSTMLNYTLPLNRPVNHNKSMIGFLAGSNQISHLNPNQTLMC